MSEAKWTPGPWKALCYKYLFIVQAGDCHVHIMEDKLKDFTQDTRDRWKADTHLIACAPALYAALETILNECIEHHAWCQLGFASNVCTCGKDEHIDKARAALAQARGEAL